jgi:CRP-like cAMP-binding protein
MQKSSKLQKLAGDNPVFGVLSPEELSAVLTAGFSRHYPKGSILAHAADLWPFLFLVVEGKIDAIKESGEGRSLLMRAISPGDIFWGLAFFHPEIGMPVMLGAAEPSTLWLWERNQLLPFLLSNGRFSWELSRLMVIKMLRASNIVEGLAFQPVAGRVARFLLEQSPSQQTPMARDLTLDQMAAHIGTTREMVCRYLRSFSDEGLISISRTEYTITDRERLARLSSQGKSG